MQKLKPTRGPAPPGREWGTSLMLLPRTSSWTNFFVSLREPVDRHE